MKPGQASRTAEYVALFRAIESARPASSRLFHDEFAHLFLGPRMRRLFRMSQLPILGPAVLRYYDSRAGARSAAVARTCYIDDTLQSALKTGIQQVVILGAGYDCRAYRMAELSTCRVFEVDHPATLSRKRETLSLALGRIPDHVQQVATDFNEESFHGEMIAAGFDPAQRTFVIWEGVTGYLTAAAVDTTLRWIAAAARCGELVFTYLHRNVLERPDAFGDLARIKRILDDSNEPWTFGFDPGELPAYLSARGFDLLEDLGADQFRARYLRDWPGSLRGYAFYRIAHARVR